MPIVNNRQVKGEEGRPGLWRKRIVTKENGAALSSGGEVTIRPGAEIPLHTHDVEEIIFVHSGELRTALGDDQCLVGPDHTIIAPAGVTHGMLNTGKTDARIITFFPSSSPRTTFTGQG